MMNIQYDIDQCQGILQRLIDSIEKIEKCDQQLYSELAIIESFWEGTASESFFENAYHNEESYLKNLVLFKEAAKAMVQIHNSYYSAKELVDNKFREIENG